MIIPSLENRSENRSFVENTYSDFFGMEIFYKRNFGALEILRDFSL